MIQDDGGGQWGSHHSLVIDQLTPISDSPKINPH